jgi:membrane associated rhomboid family serine protease
METPVRTARRQTRVQEWALVLAAAGIPYRIEHDGAGFFLLVPDSDAPQAQAALDAYDEEAGGERHAAFVERSSSPRLAWAVGVAVATVLLAFFALTGPPAAGSRWFEHGAASARLIVGGEPWRAVTALTLHVNAFHVAGNALATAVLLPAIVQQFGLGGGLWLVLLAGAVGNLLAALVYNPHHVAVGASTAIFGAIGILAGLQLLPAPAGAKTRRKRWPVLVASFVLVAILGAGPGADLLAHVLGLLAGGVLGLAAGAVLRRPLGAPVQWSLVALAALALIGCWRLALAAGGP